MGRKPNLYSDVARFYDYDDNERMHSDIPFYLSYAAEVCAGGDASGEILDLCCGTGRVALELARAGYKVTALDYSPAMLEVFNKKLFKQPAEIHKRITIINGNATNFFLNKRFDLIIIPYRSFQQFANIVDAVNCLKCVSVHLSQRGAFILSAYRPKAHLTKESWVYPRTKQWERQEGQSKITKYHWGEKIDVDQRLIYPVLCYEVEKAGGEKEVFYEDLTLKYYYYEELKAMIEGCGLHMEAEYGDYDRRPINTGSEFIFVTKKPAAQ